MDLTACTAHRTRTRQHPLGHTRSRFVFFASKFSEGAWLLLIIIPTLIVMFARIERYYRDAGIQLGLGTLPQVSPRPQVVDAHGVVIVPVMGISGLTELALQTAYRLGGAVTPVVVSLDPGDTADLCAQWAEWNPGVELSVLPSPHRTLIAPVVGYAQKQLDTGRHVTVLLAEVEPRRRRYQILHNQRGLVLAAALRARTDAVVATVPFRLH